MMNIKSLLIGSAAAMTMAAGAQAADAIVMPEPEPMEYVRICDVYGAGFFYIPGTETCLKIGGYFRYDIYFDGGITKLARFAPTFDVRADTEIGTLRGYAEIEINWQSAERVGVVAGAPAVITGYGTDVNPLHAYIQILRPNGGSWLFGRTEVPFTRFLGYGGPTIYDGYYSYRNGQEISYSFAGSNGFNFVAALVDDEDANFIPDAEIGFNVIRGWGSIGAIAGLDPDAAAGFAFGLKSALVINFPNTNGSFFKIAAAYTNDGASAYAISGAAAGSEFSVLAGLNLAFSQKVSLGLTAQWLSVGGFFGAVGLPVTVAENFVVTPEVVYDGPAGSVYGIVRLQRSF